MKKKLNQGSSWQLDDLPQILRVMKLIGVFMFVALLQVSASSYSQTKELTIKGNHLTLEELFEMIENQSEFSFMYNLKQIDLSKEIDVNFENQTVDKILNQVLKGTDITYTVSNRLIVIHKENNVGLRDKLAENQQRGVSGKVTDSSGSPLPGVTVVVKGTTQGTVTNSNGEYLLTDITENTTLTFSFVGMKTQEVSVGDNTTIDITMEQDAIGIEEVVAIGYGTVKKKDLTGSVASVKGESLAQRQTMKVSQALQGAIPGVSVTRSGNKPGSDGTIRIRGVTTIGDNTPLIIVDGIEGTLANVNPDDVESISVLKDAASASIYGSKAAAGVILVTTKRAQSGEFSLKYNFEYGFEKPTQVARYLDAAGYMKLQNEEKWNDNGNTGDEYPVWSKDIIDNYSSLHNENPDLYPDTDWLDLLINDNAPKQSHRVNLTAGSNKIRTNISIADEKTNGLYDGVSYENITVRANNDIIFNKLLSASVDLNYRRVISKNTANSGGTYIAQYTAAPYAALWSDGRVAEGQSGYNPYALIKYGGFDNTWTNIGEGKISIDFTPIKDLKITGTFATKLQNEKNKLFKKEIPYTAWDAPDIIIGYVSGAQNTSLTEARSDSDSHLIQFLTNYQKSIGLHHYNLMLGYESSYYFSEAMSASSEQYELSTYPYLYSANKNYLDVDGTASEHASRSFFGRIMYDFNNKYLIQMNARYDGSSRFYKDYQWGFFPSVSAGWVISEEPFLQNTSNLSFLKLRASWGTLGNERIGTYPYQSSIVLGNTVLFEGENIVSGKTAYISDYAIRDITWETTTSVDIGLDVALFKNSMGITLDYYQKQTKDMLLSIEIPDYMGVSNPDQNAGKMNTKGWDVEIRYNNKIGDLKYSISFNLSDYKSIMGDLKGTEFLGSQVKFEGSEFNEWYGYKTDGLFQTQEELDNSPVLDNSIQVGDIKYLDISGPDGVPDGLISPEYDRVLLGGSLPRFLYGSNISLNYKNLDLSIVFQGVGKQNARLYPQMLYKPNNDVASSISGNYWSHYNSDEQNLSVKYPRISYSAFNSTYNTFSDYWLFNGAYLRLKNITIGYTIPDRVAKKCLLKNARVYASISDLFSIDNYPEGWDPETTTSSYWITSSYVMGISVNF